MKRTLTAILVLLATSGYAQGTKISALTDGSPMQDGDLVPIARGGSNFSIPGSDLCRVADCTMTAPILGVTGCTSPMFGFTDDANAGLCLSEVDALILSPDTSATTSSGRVALGSNNALFGFYDGSSLLNGTFVNATGPIWFVGNVAVASLTSLSLSSTVPFLAPAGSDSAPSYSFSGGPSSGWYGSGAGLRASVGGTNGFFVGSGGVGFQSGGGIFWSSGADPGSSFDTGLARSAAGVVRHTNGSTGLGYSIGGVSVEANTGTKAPTVVESGELYTNTGDADGSTINLPNDPTIGTQYRVALTVAQTVTINAAAGETIQDVGTSGTSTSAGAIGDTIHLVAVTGGSGAIWMVVSKTGTWTTS